MSAATTAADSGGLRTGLTLLAVPLALGAGRSPAWGVDAFCAVDCNEDGAVGIAELLRGTNIALGLAPLTSCERADRNQNGTIGIDELIAGTSRALQGCPQLALQVSIHNTSLATVTLSGTRLSGPALGAREKTSYEGGSRE